MWEYIKKSDTFSGTGVFVGASIIKVGALGSVELAPHSISGWLLKN